MKEVQLLEHSKPEQRTFVVDRSKVVVDRPKEAVLRMRVEKPSAWATVFSVFLTIQEYPSQDSNDT